VSLIVQIITFLLFDFYPTVACLFITRNPLSLFSDAPDDASKSAVSLVNFNSSGLFNSSKFSLFELCARMGQNEGQFGALTGSALIFNTVVGMGIWALPKVSEIMKLKSLSRF